MRRGDSNEYPQSMFWAEIWRISEFFIWKFSCFGGKIFRVFEYACFHNGCFQTGFMDISDGALGLGSVGRLASPRVVGIKGTGYIR